MVVGCTRNIGVGWSGDIYKSQIENSCHLNVPFFCAEGHTHDTRAYTTVRFNYSFLVCTVPLCTAEAMIRPN